MSKDKDRNPHLPGGVWLELWKKWSEAGLVPERVTRMVIDVKIEGLVRVYYETLGCSELVEDADLIRLIDAAEKRPLVEPGDNANG